MFTVLAPRSSQARHLNCRARRVMLPAVYEAPIQTEATIVHVRKPGVFDARLPNGKLTCAHVSKSLGSTAHDIPPGTRVLLDLTPFDFDTARIAAIIESVPLK